MEQQPVPQSPVRFNRNDLFYFASLLALFVGLWLQFSLGIALITLGGLGVGISVVTSFFVTWLSAREK